MKTIKTIDIETIRNLDKNNYAQCGNSFFNNIMQAREMVRTIQNSGGGLDKKRMEQVEEWSAQIEEANTILNEKRTEFGAVAPPGEGIDKPSGGYQNNNSSSFDEKALQVLSIQNNEQVLKKRKEDLIQIKQVANQVKVITDVMKTEVYQQGSNLGTIEDNFVGIGGNMEKAYEEIIKANKLSKKNQHKMCFFIFLALFVAAIIIGLILYLIGIF